MTLIVQPPNLNADQISILSKLDALYGKNSNLRFIDGIGNYLVSGGAFGRKDADQLSKIAAIYIDHNRSLNHGKDTSGLDPKELNNAYRLIKLYNKSKGAKTFDGFGNFLLGGGFGRSDALDLVRFIRHIQEVNQLLYNHLNVDIELVPLPKRISDEQKELECEWQSAPFYCKKGTETKQLADEILLKISTVEESCPTQKAGIAEESSCQIAKLINAQFLDSMDNYLQLLKDATIQDLSGKKNSNVEKIFNRQKIEACQQRENWAFKVKVYEEVRIENARKLILQRARILESNIMDDPDFISLEDVAELKQIEVLMNSISPHLPLKIGGRTVLEFLVDNKIDS